MILSKRKDSDVLILELSGKVDAQHENIELELLEAIQDESKILLNCQKLSYINSIGLRAFLKILKQVVHQNGKLIMCCIPQNIKDFLLITGFLQLFEVYDTEEQGINVFNEAL